MGIFKIHCSRSFSVFGSALLIIVSALTGCGSYSTTKPVYQGLLAEGATPSQSSRRLPEVRQASGVIVVLSESTRETLENFRNPKIAAVKKWPVDDWVIRIAQPVRELNQSVRTASDLRSIPPGHWAVVVHWASLFMPFKIGGTVEYHVLDPDLGRVAVFSAESTGNCDSVSLNLQALQDHYAKCYDAFLRDLIDKASAPMLVAAGK